MAKKIEVLVVGCGNMGSALVRGLVKSTFGKQIEISIFDQHSELTESLSRECAVQACSDVKKINAKADLIVFCVKPHDMPTAASHFKNKLNPRSLCVSILAGTTMEEVSQALGFKGAIVRAMPNIAATVGEAATAMCANESCSAEHRETAEKVFKSFGEAYWTKESLMDAVTGLSGSGPAYFYMIIEALTDGGVRMGMPRDLASHLAVQTCLGAAKLVKVSGLHPAILRDQVTTPAGTTINAIHELEAHGLRAMLMSAVATATEKAATLRKK